MVQTLVNDNRMIGNDQSRKKNYLENPELSAFKSVHNLPMQRIHIEPMKIFLSPMSLVVLTRSLGFKESLVIIMYSFNSFATIGLINSV